MLLCDWTPAWIRFACRCCESRDLKHGVITGVVRVNCGIDCEAGCLSVVPGENKPVARGRVIHASHIVIKTNKKTHQVMIAFMAFLFSPYMVCFGGIVYCAY